ncbi:MAG: 50S ribosomal protein L22 [Chitinivibrionales bacterium]|nr:50S ribosomal protein L22 [Chitinivibrionales bacterium]MBD3356232.1 50S ribosomal protein L22 [Chitinivibrionales bacterium]
MEAKATAKYIRSGAQKARLVADQVRGKMVGDALALLDYSVKKGVARDIAKVIKSAAANVESKHPDENVDAEDLRVKEIFIDEGPSFSRFRARAQGRVGRIVKRMCHITVKVSN